MASRLISDHIKKKSSARSSLRPNDLALWDVPRTYLADWAFAYGSHRCGASFLRLLEWFQMLTRSKDSLRRKLVTFCDDIFTFNFLL